MVFKPVGVDENGKFPTRVEEALSATYLPQSKLPYIDVDLQRLPGDTDDAVVWQRSVNAAKTLGIKRVVGRAAEYVFKSYVNLGGCNGMSIEGAGRMSTIIRPGVFLNYAFTAFTDASDLVFRNIGFIGTAVDDATQPRRARTFTGHDGFAVAIKLQASPMVGYTNTLENVTLDNVHIEGTSTLPVLLGGVKGEAKIINSTIHNCMDVGFIFCDSAVFIGNTVSKSADNGVSMSRGNNRVVCTGNSFNNCAYWAIWVAGYAGDAAPKDITVTGNVGTMLGHGGVTGALGARNGVISGNTFRDIRRGPTDQPSDDACGVGIFLSSYPSDPTAPTIYADNWSITGNTVIDAARGGVLLSGGVRNVGIYSNVFIRMGSQFYADGTTVVTTAASGQNFGVAAEPTYSALVKNVDIQGNSFVDDRATPYMNAGAIGTSAVNWTQNNNKAIGTRLQLTESAKTITTGVFTYTGETRFSSGFRVGFSGATGTVAGRITGAAAATQAVSLQTEDVTRWQVKSNSGAESGSNAGSDFQLEAFSDAGASLGAAFTVVRSTQGFRHENKPLGFYGTAPIAKQTGTPAAATDLTTTQALVNDLRAKLVALGLIG